MPVVAVGTTVAAGIDAEAGGRIRGGALRRSLYFNMLAWVFGAFWMASTSGATLTELTNYFRGNDAIFGYLAAVPFLGALLQLFGSMAVQHYRRRKGVFLWGLTLQRVLYIPMALLPWVFPAGHQAAAWALVGLLFVASAAGNFGGQAWVNWMADLVPERVRGKYFAKRSRIGIVVVGLTALGVGALMDLAKTGAMESMLAPVRGAVPALIFLISIIFVLAAICGTTDIQSFHKVDEPPMARHDNGKSMLLSVAEPLVDRQFRWYMAYLALFNLSMGFVGTFAWKYLTEMIDHLDATAHPWLARHPYLAAYVLLTVAVSLGQFTGYPIWGRLVDRMGRKPVILISVVLHTLTLVFWVVASPALLIAGLFVQFLAGLVSGGQDVANFNMMLGFNSKGGPHYQSVQGVLVSVAGAASGILAGYFASFLSGHEQAGVLFTACGHEFNRYNMLFAAGIVVKCVADFGLLPRVSDTQAKPTRFAIQYILDTMYDNMHTRILAPVRSLSLLPAESFRPWRWFK